MIITHCRLENIKIKKRGYAIDRKTCKKKKKHTQLYSNKHKPIKILH